MTTYSEAAPKALSNAHRVRNRYAMSMARGAGSIFDIFGVSSPVDRVQLPYSDEDALSSDGIAVCRDFENAYLSILKRR